MARKGKRTMANSTTRHNNGAGAGDGVGAGDWDFGKCVLDPATEYRRRQGYISLERHYKAACEGNDERKKEQLLDTMNYYSRSLLSVEQQILFHSMPLLEQEVISPSLTEPVLNSFTGIERRVRCYQVLTETLGRFLKEGHYLIYYLRTSLGRWDPDLKAVANAAKAFKSLAKLICWDEMGELLNKLEAASLEGNSPMEIYGPFWRASVLYDKYRMKLYFLMLVAHRGLGTRTPPPLLGDPLPGVCIPPFPPGAGGASAPAST